MQLPRIDFSGVDPSAPGTGTWSAVRAQVMEALTTVGCFDAQYPALEPEQRASLFDGAVRPLFALPADAKRRNYYGADKPFHGYLGDIQGYDGYESPAIVDGTKLELVRDFAGLMWPGGGSNDGFWMVMEGLGVAEHHEPLDESMRHLFRMWEYGDTGEKKIRHHGSPGPHQDTNALSLVCQHEVAGLEVRTKGGEWIRVEPTPASLVVMVGNAFRAWTNDRLHAPFHRVTVRGDATRYSVILFSIPGCKIQAPDELVDDENPPHFKPYYHDDFVGFCVSEGEGGACREDKLKAYCGL